MPWLALAVALVLLALVVLAATGHLHLAQAWFVKRSPLHEAWVVKRNPLWLLKR